MIAKLLLKHFKDTGTWVDWKNTVDQFLYGNPDTEVKGIAVSWMSTFSILKKAIDNKCNLLVVHEPLLAAEINEEGDIISGPIIKDLHSRWLTRNMKLKKDDIWLKKMAWLEENDITVLRCHDYWDNYPKIGVHGAWARFLGLTNPPIREIPYYELHKIPETTLEEFVKGILEKTKQLGQDSIQVIGNLKKKISYVTIGTGAATNHRDMFSMGPDPNGPDAIIISEDGTYLWASAQWAEDTGIPLIIVNHALSEEPGMITLTQFLKEKFPKIPVTHIPVGCLFKSIF